MPNSFTETDYKLDANSADKANAQDANSERDMPNKPNTHSRAERTEREERLQEQLERMRQERDEARASNEELLRLGQRLEQTGASVARNIVVRQSAAITTTNDIILQSKDNLQKAMPKVWYKSVSVWLGATALVFGTAALSTGLFFPPAMALAAYLLPTGVGLLAASGLIGLIKGVRSQAKKPFLGQLNTIKDVDNKDQILGEFDEARRNFHYVVQPTPLRRALGHVQENYEGQQQSPAELLVSQRERETTSSVTHSASQESFSDSHNEASLSETESDTDSFLPRI